MSPRRTCVVAFSGDLPSTYLVASLAREGWEVVAVSVAAGSLEPEALPALGERARALGAADHVGVDAQDEVWARTLVPLLQGNVLRHGTDPLWSAAESYHLAEQLAAEARRREATRVAYAADASWSGNAATRLEVSLQALLPDVEVVAPARDDALLPAEMRAFLSEVGLGEAAADSGGDAPGVQAGDAGAGATRVRSRWGDEVSGGPLDDPWSPPDEAVEAALPDAIPPWEASELPEEFDVAFEVGVPTGAFGTPLDGINLIAALAKLGRRHAVGLELHQGETALGFKRRSALDVPAAVILIEAHRALEEAVLTDRQLLIKDRLALDYGDLFHRGLYHAPEMRDLECLFASSQRLVTGTVRLRIYRGRVQAIGVRSGASLIDPDRVGNETELWDGRDAEGYARLLGLPVLMATRRGRPAPEPTPEPE